VSGRIAPPPGQLKKADFVSDQEVRWCPGCGDYAILNKRAKGYARISASRARRSVFVSGIGARRVFRTT
jgi:2-oxoglutarate ferredoxin oxidoreductase subunit beta